MDHLDSRAGQRPGLPAGLAQTTPPARHRLRGWIGAAALAAALATGAPAALALPMSAAVQAHKHWVLFSGDNEGGPFVVIDKQRARLWLFDAFGRPLGDTPVLLGKAVGDTSAPGIGDKPLAEIAEHERTTPAGRFVAEAGRNHTGEDILWVDYDAAVSMHRVRASNPAERRLQRLASATPDDNRISYGCINVPAAFYDRRLRPLLAAPGVRGVVYVLPEVLPREALFKALPPLRRVAVRVMS